MFTGLVSELGTVVGHDAAAASGGRITVACGLAEEPGASVAVNGACLTVVEHDAEAGTLAFDVMPETLRVTALGSLEAGSRVNLEPALRAGQPLGGHIVQGHVDGIGHVARQQPEGNALLVEVELPADLGRYVVERGSICIDGVSLTVMGRPDGRVLLSLIPETRDRTTLGGMRDGQPVNVEVDVLARYVEAALSSRLAGS